MGGRGSANAPAASGSSSNTTEDGLAGCASSRCSMAHNTPRTIASASIRRSRYSASAISLLSATKRPERKRAFVGVVNNSQTHALSRRLRALLRASRPGGKVSVKLRL